MTDDEMRILTALVRRTPVEFYETYAISGVVIGGDVRVAQPFFAHLSMRGLLARPITHAHSPPVLISLMAELIPFAAVNMNGPYAVLLMDVVRDRFPDLVNTVFRCDDYDGTTLQHLLYHSRTHDTLAESYIETLLDVQERGTLPLPENTLMNAAVSRSIRLVKNIHNRLLQRECSEGGTEALLYIGLRLDQLEERGVQTLSAAQRDEIPILETMRDVLLGIEDVSMR